MTKLKTMFQIKSWRVYKYDDKKILEYCIMNPFYQNINGIVIPFTIAFITNYCHKRRRTGPLDVQAKFKQITDPLIKEVIINGPS